MAAFTITPADVTAGQDYITTPAYRCDVAITAGQVVYFDEATEGVNLANNSASTTTEVRGIALTSAGINGYILVAESGVINPGFTTTVGHLYYLGNANGAVVPWADIAADSGAYVSALYRGVTTSTVTLEINNTGNAIA